MNPLDTKEAREFAAQMEGEVARLVTQWQDDIDGLLVALQPPDDDLAWLDVHEHQPAEDPGAA